MLEQYKTVYEGREAEIVEKKSRFIANVRHVESEEEALAFIEEIRKKYWDARHHCFAYTIGEHREVVRAGDDGEPSGTAGRPMLDVLLGGGLFDTAAVVTRYFGGTLLGTGGLVRAYSQAVQEGLAASTVIDKIYGVLMEIGTDYSGVGKVQYILGQNKIPVMDSAYTDRVRITALVKKTEAKRFAAELTEATNGRAVLTELQELYYAEIDGEIRVGDELKAGGRNGQ